MPTHSHTPSSFPEPDEVVKQLFNEVYNNDPNNLQKALHAIKKYDSNPLEAMRVVVWKFKIQLGEAKHMVMASDAWNS